MTMLIKTASSHNDIKMIERLANIIWNEHFTAIIGKAQVDYMLHKFQSREAIAEQIKQGFLYFLLQKDHKYIGYMGVLAKYDELLLSKLYILCSARQKGYGKKALSFIELLAIKKGINKITLTVNKYNTGTIKIYEKSGFENINSVVKDIGNGFVMDDYNMVKKLKPVSL
ncbi:MAG: GNAT family N-acetyltransferase [Thiotrichaceae bacterium]|nr:GNAT family N-acetyltransferase [Thiotrichaceae bacterium]